VRVSTAERRVGVEEWRHGILGGFAELRKATVSFVMSVRLELLGSHWTDFHENLQRKFRFHLKAPRITGIYVKTREHLL